MFQTALNPAPPDPVQAKMMWIMPLAFSVMFFYFPAGLVLYWVTNNVLSIAQQWLINTRMGVAGAVSTCRNLISRHERRLARHDFAGGPSGPPRRPMTAGSAFMRTRTMVRWDG